MSQVSEHRSVSTQQARESIVRCFKAKRPVFLWGPPGIGKSELIEEITNELSGALIDIRMGTMEQTDIRGIPFFNKESGKMEWAPPIELPSEEFCAQYPVVVLFLDEMPSAPPSVQASAYQLILNRRVGTYQLPKNVVIVAAGNRESDRGVTYKMPSPLANRFVHLEIKVDFDSWYEWAISNEIHKDIVGYLSEFKGDLFDFQPSVSGRSFATPRSWSFVDDILDDECPESILTDLIAGTVGEGLAIKFMAARRLSAKMPKALDVLFGKVTKLENKDISAMYALSTSMCYELKAQYDKSLTNADEKKLFNTMADNFTKFLSEEFTAEMAVMAMRAVLKVYQIRFDVMNMKHLKDYQKKYGKYIIGANTGKV